MVHGERVSLTVCVFALGLAGFWLISLSPSSVAGFGSLGFVLKFWAMAM